MPTNLDADFDANANANANANASADFNELQRDDYQAARQRVSSLREFLQASEREPVRLIETHISWVLLAESVAYKLKKPLRLPFLDFSTLALRRHFCAEEVRLNERLAPSAYLGVVEVRAGPAGAEFGGEGPVREVAVRMRRFPDGALWSELLAAGRLTPLHIDAMAERLAQFHRDAAVAPPGSSFGSAASHASVVQGLARGIDGDPALSSAPEWPALRNWLMAQPPQLAPLWAARLREGRVRECHGDLHLANVLQLHGQPAAFDGIEFDPALRWIDVLDDIAFLAMDLMANGARALAFRFINAYLQSSGEHEGLPALRYYLVCRAVVRARVVSMAAQQAIRPAAQASQAAAYMALASALSTGGDARLAITHGLPGSGKSHAAQAVAEEAGAICVRSDVERKRFFGLGALESSHGRIAGGIYGAATTLRTYARLAELARVALAAGWPVVVDAAFLQRTERAAFAALAAECAAPFNIIDCRAEPAVLRQRLKQRQATGGDASEADADVLERLTAADEPLSEAERIGAFVIDAGDAGDAAPSAGLASRWRAATVGEGALSVR